VAAYDRWVSTEPAAAVIDLTKPSTGPAALVDDQAAESPAPASSTPAHASSTPAHASSTPAHASSTPLPDTGGARLADAVRRRLQTVARDPMSWFATGFVVLIGAVLRLYNLRHPATKIFDEVYYATEADELLAHGVEWRPENNAGDYVVHPPLGKWCIALGEWLFGYDSFGWRISAAVAGIISILLITRIARRLFRSTVLGCAAGLLVALDGLHLVLSRSALLDIFLTLFVVAAFGCLLLDRDQRRARWLAALSAGVAPKLGLPHWRLVAALFMGAACGVKLSGAFFIPAFVLLILIWEIGLRRTVGASNPWVFGTLNVAGWSFGMAAIVVGAYVASWTGWFLSDSGWNRHGLASRGESEPPVIGALINLWEYHKQAYEFHTGLNSPHDYQSWPWQWLLMGRPVAFYWDANLPCGSDKCAAEVLLLGTPLLWWSFIPALAALIWLGIAQRDRRAGVIGLMVAAALLPWFWYHFDGGRTMFVFYALPALPFLVFAVVYVLGALMGPPGPRTAPVPDRRLIGSVAAGVYVLLVGACLLYFLPIYVGDSIPYADWWDRMLLGRRWV
jgi:dolichyl-phosphate-mannose--protein O-mannosyl transferase